MTKTISQLANQYSLLNIFHCNPSSNVRNLLRIWSPFATTDHSHEKFFEAARKHQPWATELCCTNTIVYSIKRRNAAIVGRLFTTNTLDLKIAN